MLTIMLKIVPFHHICKQAFDLALASLTKLTLSSSSTLTFIMVIFQAILTPSDN